MTHKEPLTSQRARRIQSISDSEPREINLTEDLKPANIPETPRTSVDGTETYACGISETTETAEIFRGEESDVDIDPMDFGDKDPSKNRESGLTLLGCQTPPLNQYPQTLRECHARLAKSDKKWALQKEGYESSLKILQESNDDKDRRIRDLETQNSLLTGELRLAQRNNNPVRSEIVQPKSMPQEKLIKRRRL